MRKIVDVGEGWGAMTGGLPLPLGGNVIRRSLGPERIATVSRLCRASIAWALAHRDEVIDALLAAEARVGLALDRALLDRYLTMYANADSADFAPDAREAVGVLFDRARAAGLLTGDAKPQFAP
jgi:1,4-dihydroxy-6-naphthoate synthase